MRPALPAPADTRLLPLGSAHAAHKNGRDRPSSAPSAQFAPVAPPSSRLRWRSRSPASSLSAQLSVPGPSVLPPMSPERRHSKCNGGLSRPGSAARPQPTFLTNTGGRARVSRNDRPELNPAAICLRGCPGRAKVPPLPHRPLSAQSRRGKRTVLAEPYARSP